MCVVLINIIDHLITTASQLGEVDVAYKVMNLHEFAFYLTFHERNYGDH